MFIEPEIFEISFKELKKIWKVVKEFNCVLIGGWAAFFLINENFRKERKHEYIGSRDIDFAVLSNDLTKVFEVMEKQGFFPISFRYCKIYSRELRKFVTESEASKFPLHDLFYFFVDFVTDAKPKNLSFTVFEDRIVKFMFENKLFLRKNNMRVVIPELLVLSKLRMLKQRDEEKRIKDAIDAMMVYTFYENFENNLFNEFAEKFGFDKKFAWKEIEGAREHLKLLGFSETEVTNIIISFSSLIFRKQ